MPTDMFDNPSVLNMYKRYKEQNYQPKMLSSKQNSKIRMGVQKGIVVSNKNIHYLPMHSDEFAGIPFSPWGEYYIPKFSAILLATYKVKTRIKRVFPQ